MSSNVESFPATLSEQTVHLSRLEARDIRMEQIKASSELIDVEERMGKLIMEQMYWQDRLNRATASLAAEASLVAEEALKAKADRKTLMSTVASLLGTLATGQLTEVPADNHTERILTLVETPHEYPPDGNVDVAFAS